MEALKGLHLSPNAVKVLEKRYLKKDEEGKVVEAPEDLFKRVAKSVAAADLQYGKSFEEVGIRRERILYNAHLSQFSSEQPHPDERREKARAAERLFRSSG